MRIILASSSITRRKIMDKLKIKYDIVTSDVEEKSSKEDPIEYVKELSRNKAESVSKKVSSKNSIIIAADSIIYKDGKKYEKPKSIDEVKQNLRELSGTDVYFKEISEEDIEWYVKHEENLLKKAGYSLEGIMSLFLERLDGDYYNVLGLPLGKLYKCINEFGYSLKDLD